MRGKHWHKAKYAASKMAKFNDSLDNLADHLKIDKKDPKAIKALRSLIHRMGDLPRTSDK